MANFTKNAIWKNNQVLTGRKQMLQAALAEVRKLRKEITELEAIKSALTEVQ